MIKFYHPRGVQELFWRAGQTTEKVAFRRLTKKYPKQARKAHKLAQLKGIKKVESLGKRHGIEGLFSVKDKPRSFFKAKKGGLPKGSTLEEMGWAPSAPLSAEAIAVKRAQSPKALLKKHFITIPWKLPCGLFRPETIRYFPRNLAGTRMFRFGAYKGIRN